MSILPRSGSVDRGFRPATYQDPGTQTRPQTAKDHMIKTLFWAVLVGMALLLDFATALASGDGRMEPGIRGHTRSDHRGSRPNGVRRRASGGQRVLSNPGVWWAPSEPASPDTGSPLVIIQTSPMSIQEEPPPAPTEPAYYWYYCGPEGKGPSPRKQATSYCIGGLNPSLRGFPGPGKTLEQFQADDAACQHWASGHAGTLPGPAASEDAPSSVAAGASPTAFGSMQGRYDLAYQQCLYAKGNRFPAMAGPTQPQYPVPPPPPPR